MQAPKIQLVSSSESKSDAIVLGWYQEDTNGKPKSGQPSLHYIGKRGKDVDALSSLLSKSKHFFAKKNETNLLRFYSLMGFPNVILLGLGSVKKWNVEQARQAGAAVYSAQKRERLSRVAVESESVFSKIKKDELPGYVQGFCEGYLLAAYEYRELKKEEPHLFYPQGLELLGLKGSSLEEASHHAVVLAKAVNFARYLGDQPANYLTPTAFAKACERMAKDRGLKCTVLGRTEIEKEKMGLFLGVAKGSAEEPKFIILEHRGGKKTDKPIALVGKGITFDSGGISIKPAARMEEMKYDMMGAAAVAGTLQAVSELKLPMNVIGFIAATENMPGGKAQKPGDVARSISGKTVEIINTDAEGRLILGDALEYAQKHSPAAILDFATLTGAVVSALGTVTTGIMGNNRGLLDRIKDSAGATGERVWELPLYEEYEEDLKSNVADIKNSGVGEAGASKGGTFLKFFVDPKFPWVHCDIAGSAWYRKDVNYHHPKTAAGVMVRLLAHLLENWKPLAA